MVPAQKVIGVLHPRMLQFQLLSRPLNPKKMKIDSDTNHSSEIHDESLDILPTVVPNSTHSNPENTVGIMTIVGKGVRVRVTPTSDFGKILASMHGLEVGGEVNLTSSVQIAELALKHRQNKKQQQRIIVFIGSPVKSDKKILEVIGKKLKKNNVALDIVDFREDDDGKSEKLDALLASVNSNENSHIVHVRAGPNVLTNVLISSAIFTRDGEARSGFAGAAAASAAVAAGGAGNFDFDVDPNLDPELALALRVSMDEEIRGEQSPMHESFDSLSQSPSVSKDTGTAIQ